VVLRVEGAHRRGRERGHGAYTGDDLANVADSTVLPDLLHGEERKACRPADEDLSAGIPRGATAAIRAGSKPSETPLRKPRI